jgi:AraC-like DNA-binding protein
LIELIKNSARGSYEIYNENNELIVVKLNNTKKEPYSLQKNIIKELVHLYICLEGSVSVEIHDQHYSFPLKEDSSTLIFIKNFTPLLKFYMQPNTKVIGIYISVNKLHALFAQDTDQLPVFDSIDIGQRIIESAINKPEVREVAFQLFTKNLSETYQSIYVKGKLLEILSTFFYATEKDNREQCPYIANKESAAKIKKAKTIIIGNLTETPSLNNLAKMVGLNIKALKEGFKELYGKPVITYLFHYRMEEAKKMIKKGGKNISEIAPQIGYSSASHFITAFKRKFGVTPKQYLKYEHKFGS